MTRPINNNADTFKFGNRTRAINDMHKPVAITKQIKDQEKSKSILRFLYHP
jgi:hypothetical protein